MDKQGGRFTKQCETQIDEAFNKHGKNVQIPIMDLAKISQAGQAAYKAGESVEEAVRAAIEKYRVKPTP